MSISDFAPNSVRWLYNRVDHKDKNWKAKTMTCPSPGTQCTMLNHSLINLFIKPEETNTEAGNQEWCDCTVGKRKKNRHQQWNSSRKNIKMLRFSKWYNLTGNTDCRTLETMNGDFNGLNYHYWRGQCKNSQSDDLGNFLFFFHSYIVS